MAFGSTDVLKMLLTADGAQAINEFKKVSNSASKELDKAGQSTKTFSQKITSGLDSIVGKSPGAQRALASMGVTTAQLGTVLATAVPAAAAGAAIAVGKFAVDGATKFENLALQVDAFTKATGLSAVEASKFIEVAKDLKIDPTTFETAFAKMEKAISTNRAAFGGLVKTAKDGSVDLTATFLSVVKHLQGIKDPIDRANEASKFFGRGFTGIAQIIGTSADELKGRLDAVGQQAGKIITSEEISQAQKYRDALDSMHDSVENLQLELGQALVPALSQAATDAATFIGILDKGATVLGGFENVTQGLIRSMPGLNLFFAAGDLAKGGVSNWGKFKNVLSDVTRVSGFIPGLHREMASAVGQSAKAANEAAANYEHFGSSLHAAGVDTEVVSGAFADYSGTIHSAGLEVDALTTATGKSVGQLQAQNAALLTATAGVLGYIDAQTGADQAQLALVRDTKAANEAILASAAAKGKDAEANAAQKVAIDQVIGDTRALAQHQIELAGKTNDAAASQRILVGAFKSAAAQASGPVRAALLGVVTQLQNVGAQHPKPTVTLTGAEIAQAKAGQIQREMDALDGRHASVAVTADTGGAQARLDALAHRLSALASTGTLVLGRVGAPVRFAEGGYVKAARGTEVPAIVHGGEYVLSSDIVDRIKRGQASSGSRPRAPSVPPTLGSDGASVYHITVNTVLGDAVAISKQLKSIMAAGERAGVR